MKLGKVEVSHNVQCVASQILSLVCVQRAKKKEAGRGQHEHLFPLLGVEEPARCMTILPQIVSSG